MAVARQALADHRAGEHVERGEQRRGAVALVVVGHRSRPALLDRQRRLRAVERLDLALFVHAQDDRVLRRVQVQPDHVDELLLEPLVVGELERLHLVRLQAARRPDPLHRRRADTRGPWPSTGSSSASHPQASRAASRGRSPRPSPSGSTASVPAPGRTRRERLRALQREPCPPSAHRRRRHTELSAAIRVVRHPVGRQQQHARPLHITMRGRPRTRDSLSSTSRCSGGHHKRRSRRAHRLTLPQTPLIYKTLH